MGMMRAGLVGMAMAALAISASAKTETHASLNCPSAASEQRMDALESQLDSLDQRLDVLSGKVDQLADARRDALDQAKDRIESAVHDDGLSQEQIDREVAKALAEAQTRGEAAARTAQAIQHAMDEVKTQMAALRQQMQALAGRHVVKDPDAG